MPLGDIPKQAIPRPIRPQFEAAAKALKPLSRVQKRLLEPCPEHELEICFQHTVLCQTGLPYRDPGEVEILSARMVPPPQTQAMSTAEALFVLLAGWKMLRFTPAMVEDGTAVDMLRSMLDDANNRPARAR